MPHPANCARVAFFRGALILRGPQRSAVPSAVLGACGAVGEIAVWASSGVRSKTSVNPRLARSPSNSAGLRRSFQCSTDDHPRQGLASPSRSSPVDGSSAMNKKTVRASGNEARRKAQRNADHARVRGNRRAPAPSRRSRTASGSKPPNFQLITVGLPFQVGPAPCTTSSRPADGPPFAHSLLNLASCLSQVINSRGAQGSEQNRFAARREHIEPLRRR